ncbi:Asp-tRNA(Asn)/Glu-tRNA(Gln) amidotransferase subunit GatB [Lachnoclostridium phytofermentans]|uniref:Aspartyl/glutamyl-tRNA(Asn/Gln) amidotransferase subunit B n=1 Tax=Lachnoclostridium phytofermentans (strain ATCC 700394 / DSM 18823 / ISDg) TaxID=357809 RepID=GATB_LACP7|nr:Asp-tRNA(Asn)/Glu-tRNA(Gln) amidotransferase subunit GatB [Lachnoclostridium phytofermentans]A9KJ27.1 RecName: Full=Aspartyl/glutamyl-tRNA(Asn/Gln) amidotransferase subunit B; Short=Asp/Glu-ADT subunit B [Lachnoclostridium phytofermentans ISDg]ABX41026.1 glutamyl-tRNA(Gln) amidotransferase, B subunit [Lachnoclostridium phytofermentans ISDg]
MKVYETVIGLEVHVELATKSKIFCGCTTQFGGEVNAHCCPICMGMPGTLPVLNKKVVEFAIAAGLAMNCDITKNCKFDRKNYFYPDLPKAYQVSQLYLPICRNGSIEIEVDGIKKSIGIHEIHMEEDAGKLVHDPWEDCTLVDYNRCGVPLIEIVSEPDMRSAEEVIAYLEKLKLILQYLGVSDCKMQEGSLRADINLSIREVGEPEFGTRTEMKNMNSFKAIARAIEGERKRQIELLEDGKKVIQETRRWDDNKDTSFAMRSKEDAQDYRYFPEPDLVPMEISEEWLTEIKGREPELRDAKMLRYVKEYEIPEYDAGIITGSKNLADIFEATVSLCNKPKEVSNWLMVETMRLLKESEQDAEELKLSPANFASLIELIDAGKINRTIAKEVFEQIFKANVDPNAYIEEHGLGMVSDDGVVRSTIENILKENVQSVSDYKNGKDKAFGFLVGQTMKAMRGKANPSVINEILRELLSKA